MNKTNFVLCSAFCICLFSLLITVTAAEAGSSRFAQGFRGIPWQTHKNDLPDLGLSPKALKNIYKSGPASVLFMEGKGNLELQLDGVPLLSLFMHFNNQLFTGVDMLFKPENREKVISIIRSESGQPTNGENGELWWRDDQVKIVVTARELLISF